MVRAPFPVSMFVALGVIGLSVSACQTSEQAEADVERWLNAEYRGKRLSEFVTRNGVVPENMFEMGGRRVFIFGPPCVSWWHARAETPTGRTRGPDDFVVERVEVRGYCR